MKDLLNIINSKITNLSFNIEELLYDALNLTLNEIKKDFKENKNLNLKEHFEKLNNINTLKNKFLSTLNSYNSDSLPESTENLKVDSNDISDAISVSSNISQKDQEKDYKDKVNTFKNVPENGFYFHNLNSDYGEVDKKIGLSYSLTNLEDYNMFSLKISGLKLFDNIILARTLRDSMIKLFSFLFVLNEKSFINLCNKNSKYFASNPSNMKRAIKLKENSCYFESDIDEAQSAEMLKIFLNHIGVELSACKVIINCETLKEKEKYITMVL